MYVYSCYHCTGSTQWPIPTSLLDDRFCLSCGTYFHTELRHGTRSERIGFWREHHHNRRCREWWPEHLPGGCAYPNVQKCPCGLKHRATINYVWSMS